MSKEIERALDAQLDWALGEAAGGGEPPDLLAVVRSKLAAPGAMSPRPAGVRVWFAAASVLLGLGVLVAVWWDKHSPAAPVQQPESPLLQEGEPEWVTVGNAEEIERLPEDCAAVRLFPVTASYVESLGRLRHLAHLDLGLALDPITPPQPRLSASILQAAAKLTTLRELRLDYRSEIEPSWLLRLDALPLLETLSLKFVQVDIQAAASLHRLPSLRRLDVSFDSALTDDGLRLLATIPSLRELSLRGCGGLTHTGLTVLGKARQLEVLDLSFVAGTRISADAYYRVTIDAGNGAPDGEALQRTEQLLAGMTLLAPNQGVTDELLLALRPLDNLRVLRLLGCAAITARGLAVLTDKPILWLDLCIRDSGCAGFAQQLPSTLETLGLAHSKLLTDADATAMAKRLPMLQQLDLTQCTALGDAGLRALLQHCPLRRLNLRGCRGLSAESLQALLAKSTLRQLEVSGLSWIDADAEQRLRAMPGMQLENRRGG